tara:strand:+ start:340 stop:1746 length:1407 start_codon:yes stop_codon:yes gene_type:complete
MSDNIVEYDLIVVGGGPGGYVAAIRAAQLGIRVICIEKRESFGGTCLNIGCIPSKTLLHSSHLYEQSKNHLVKYGIEVNGEITLNLKKMMDNKVDTVKKLTTGIAGLFKKNKVEYLIGKAKFINNNTLEVNKKKIKANKILIATGSIPTNIPGIKIDEKNIVSSTGALEFERVPRKLAVIGGGYIGLELGSVWNRLGADVTVIEFTDALVPTMDKDIAAIFHSTLSKQGIKFMLSTKVESALVEKEKVQIKCLNLSNSSSENFEFDKVLVSVGRKPFTEGLGLENLNLNMNKTGTIKVDKNFQTNVDGIFAIGDVIEGPMLAHKASSEGHVFAEQLAGNKPEINYQCIPAVVYTEPEVAWVGPTEKELKNKNIAYKKGVFPFSANARGKTTGDSTGTIKFLSDKDTDKVLAVHIIGAHAGELIGEAVAAIEAGLTAEDIALICHAHPTLSESMKEAASLSSTGQTLHF